MDVNSNRGNHAVNKPKHISRLRKEMLQHRMYNNPFSSPPSSTGSHDTVSTTDDLSRNLSNFSFSPDDEGTRRFSDDFQNPSKRHTSRPGRFGPKQSPDMVLNTSAIARAFPEWTGLVGKDTMTFSQTVDMAAPANPASPTDGGKENVPPAAEYTDENSFENELHSKRKAARADMQARVENESDCSTVLSLSPGRPVGARRSRFSTGAQHLGTMSPELPKRSLQDMASKIRTDVHTTGHDITPKRAPSRQVAQPNHQTPATNVTVDHSGISRSFFLPAFRHLPDWTSGTLRFSTMRNGVPIFVRSGKSGVRFTQSGKNHNDIHAVGITTEDEEIFVSMDKLQEEVRELHDHDAMLQLEAEKLQREVNQLQAELKRSKARKSSDSAIGSESDASFRRSGGHDQNLEDQIAQLRGRLDQASRQVGVNDIHSAALAAERDEALHQASAARERATKLEAELDATHRDLESSLQLLQEKEALQLENASLVAENDALREQRDAAVQNNKALTTANDKLRRELTGIQKDLGTTREELASVRKQYEGLQGEKRNLAQDHVSMERNNETYFKENKKLQAQVAARDQHIADLKKGISSRDKMIDNIQGLTTDTAMIELNADLEAELGGLQEKLEQQAVELLQKDGEISAKEGRIRSLKEQNLDLSIDNERLREENQRLRTEHEEIRSQWVDERHKVDNTDYLKTLKDDTGDCVRLQDDFNQKELALQEKLDRREAAVKKVKALTRKIAEIAEQEFTGKTTKVTRILEPKDKQIADDLTGKSVEADPTIDINLTQDSDFASVMEGEITKLKQTYQALVRGQRQETDLDAAGNTVQSTDFSLPALPPVLQRSKSDSNALPARASKAAQSKGQPPGILKKFSQFAHEEDTGRFSVKSALSIASHHTDDSYEVVRTPHSRKGSMGAFNDSEDEGPRPESRLRRNSETARDPTTEPNMTSAFFMPDITLEGLNPAPSKQQQQQQVPSLSPDARRVLDKICQHKSANCNVCVRIAAHGDKHSNTGPNKILITPEDISRGKKTVSVEKPVPVSDRQQPPQNQNQNQPQNQNPDATIRPSIAPGEALAILIKETQDEIDHLQMELRHLNEAYFALDKSLGQRERRRVMGEIRRVQGEVEARSAHLYRLHDVLEGQKAAGQEMREGEVVDVTVLGGLVRAEVVMGPRGGGGSEVGWEGFE
ncbi:hypothetical protein BT67DRAFT_417219 [Trichocladium antarcticum]|uniref:Uncharacterized protein n=1 Tax=Trichocladium antarcticum TaxID=1450529 RepID=A0AAN6UQF6_9PEZI|nr:hypothetical protein BT67DRAFT_417219 [Trichocladium antarcticum]